MAEQVHLSSVVDLPTDSDVLRAITSTKRVALNFWTSWAAPCKQMNSVFSALAATTVPSTGDQVLFARISAEELLETASRFEVKDVPAFVLFYSGRVIGRVDGANPPLLAEKIAWLASASEHDLERVALVELTKRHKLMLFMKGSPDAPKCGFSRQMVELLRKAKVQFDSFDILEDQDVRNGLKKLHNWPTYPQLYASGRLLGGLDVVRELVDTNEFHEEISREVVESPVLESTKVSDVGATHTSDSTCALHVQAVSQDPLASLAGGNPHRDQTSVQNGDSAAGSTATHHDLSQDLNTRLRALVARSPVMLFMKGSPDTPRCGFSSKIVNLLREQNISFDSFDILEDPKVRQGLKDLFQWPTFPQLYSKGVLIGGLDIVQELVLANALKEELDS